MSNNEKRQGTDQELAAVQKTTDLLVQMVDFLFERERQWEPKLVEDFAAAMASGNASLRVVFDLDTTGLTALNVYGRQDGKPEKQIFNILPKRKLDS